jgi:hypothetical protein
MLPAADVASRHDPRLSERIKIQVGMYRHLQHNPQEEIKSLYLRIEDTFYQLCLGRENADTMITIIDDERVLKDLLTEMGYRKEWDDTKYEKMLKKGMKIADTVLGILVHQNVSSPEINRIR